MKKIISFAFIIAITAVIMASPIRAQEISADNQASPTPTPVIIQYDLAYPGILPDHPLYKLKVLRDKITEALISDPLKKIEFFLLQTDKGILASAILVDKNKIDLALQTALKAENNYTLLAGEINNLSKKPNKAFFDKLETANLKHQEVLKKLAQRVPQDKKKIFNQVVNFAKSNLQTVEAYKNNQ